MKKNMLFTVVIIGFLLLILFLLINYQSKDNCPKGTFKLGNDCVNDEVRNLENGPLPIGDPTLL